ncbi:SagB/ThcOx family dehydrogenase [Actinocorallia lasiicapitis]
MRVKAARCAVLFCQDGRLVWDGYLIREQYALTPEAARVHAWFARTRELSSVGTLDPGYPAIAVTLLDSGVLIEEGSDADEAEQRVLDAWGVWGPSSVYAYFSARSLGASDYVDLAEERLRTLEHSLHTPPPPTFKSYPDRPVVPLRPGRPEDRAWPRPGLVDALYGRRSQRDPSPAPLRLAELEAVLNIAGGIVESREGPTGIVDLLRTSPSAGARAPLELYLQANRVTGLDSGVYHYSPERGGLELLGPAASRGELLAAVGGQPWLADAAVLLVYTAVIGRTQWRYRTRRAYRDVAIEAGHLSQTVLLTASGLGLAATFATAVSEAELEKVIGVDGVSEVVLGVAGLSRQPQA